MKIQVQISWVGQSTTLPPEKTYSQFYIDQRASLEVKYQFFREMVPIKIWRLIDQDWWGGCKETHCTSVTSCITCFSDNHSWLISNSFLWLNQEHPKDIYSENNNIIIRYICCIPCQGIRIFSKKNTAMGLAMQKQTNVGKARFAWGRRPQLSYAWAPPGYLDSGTAYLPGSRPTETQTSGLFVRF